MEGQSRSSTGNSKRRMGLALLDLFFIMIFVSIGLVLKPDYAMIIAYLSIVPYLLATRRTHMVRIFLLSSLFAAVWLLVAHDQYGYNQNVLVFCGVNLFPLFAWACGLMGSYALFSHLGRSIRKKNIFIKLAIYISIYWPCLIGLEFLAYHVLEFRNQTTGDYPGLPLIDTMHAPHWMQLSYLAMGPLFFLAAMGLDHLKRLQRKGLSSSKEE